MVAADARLGSRPNNAIFGATPIAVSGLQLIRRQWEVVSERRPVIRRLSMVAPASRPFADLALLLGCCPQPMAPPSALSQ